MAVANGRKRIVILGGGSGGIVAATKLGRLLGRDHEVTLVDRREQHIFMPAFLFVMVGQRTPQDISRRLQRIARHNVNVIQAEIEGIDPKRQEVTLDSGKLSYDYLIISLGMQTRPDLIPGFAEGAHHPWEIESAVRLRNALESFKGGRIVVGIPLGPYRCPPAPYEVQWLIDIFLRQRGLRERTEIAFFTREPEPAGEARDPVVWMDAESKRRGIKFYYDFIVQSVDPEKKTVSGIYGYKLPYDLLVLVPPHRPAKVLLDSSMADTEAGIKVDYDTLATRWENVYAIGDCADMPASKAGGVAHQEGDVVGHNLAVKITRRGEPVPLILHTI